jgi:hypothetical protein
MSRIVNGAESQETVLTPHVNRITGYNLSWPGSRAQHLRKPEGENQDKRRTRSKENLERDRVGRAEGPVEYPQNRVQEL